MDIPYGFTDRCLFYGGVSVALSTLFCCQCTTTLVVVIAVVAAVTVYSFLKVNPGNKAVLVTGCDSGFGHAEALKLHDLGFTVFAGCLLKDKEGDGAKALEREGKKSGRLHVIQMDVSSEEQVNSAVEIVKQTLASGSTSLWAVINNAGCFSFGNVEWAPLEIYEQIAKVNLFGLIRVTKAFLPLIRRSQGRIVNVSSQAGRRGVLGCSAYCVTKYGVEGFSDCLRLEMKRFNVHVIAIEPGNFTPGTAIFTGKAADRQTQSLWSSMKDEIKSDYGEDYFQSTFTAMKRFTEAGMANIDPVLDVMTDAVLRTYPRYRYLPMSFKERVYNFIAQYLPEIFYDNLQCL